MIRQLLHQLRRRLLLQLFLNALAAGALGASGLLLVVVAVCNPLAWPTLGLLAVDALALAGGFALARIWVNCPTLPQVAKAIDQRADTQDRLATALSLESLDKMQTPLESAALAECRAYLSRFDAVRWTPIRLPSSLTWLLAPMLSILLLRLWLNPAPNSDLFEPVRTPDATTLRIAGRLEEMAGRLERQSLPAANVQKLAAAFKRGAARLRAEARGEAPAKSALREISALEELVEATRAGQDLEKLGEALAHSGEAHEAAEALKDHDLPKAADKLEELGKRLTEGKNKEHQLKQLEKALASVAAQTGGESDLGAAASKGANAAKKGDAAGTGEALGQMGKAMREKGRGESGQSAQAMISQLQELKTGKEGETKESPPTPQGPSDANAMSKATAESVGEIKPGDPKNGMTASKGGQPGSDHDVGTKESTLGKAETPTGQAGFQAQVQGMIGKGESLRSLIPAEPGKETAKTEYRALYEAMAPAAEDAMAQENIPIGSRLFVKRYFEAIRPK